MAFSWWRRPRGDVDVGELLVALDVVAVERDGHLERRGRHLDVLELRERDLAEAAPQAQAQIGQAVGGQALDHAAVVARELLPRAHVGEHALERVEGLREIGRVVERAVEAARRRPPDRRARRAG